MHCPCMSSEAISILYRLIMTIALALFMQGALKETLTLVDTTNKHQVMEKSEAQYIVQGYHITTGACM